MRRRLTNSQSLSAAACRAVIGRQLTTALALSCLYEPSAAARAANDAARPRARDTILFVFVAAALFESQFKETTACVRIQISALVGPGRPATPGRDPRGVVAARAARSAPNRRPTANGRPPPLTMKKIIDDRCRAAADTSAQTTNSQTDRRADGPTGRQSDRQ